MKFKNRLFSRLMAGVLSVACLSVSACTLNVYAEDEKTPEEIASEAAMEEAYKMPVTTNEIKNWPKGPSVYAESAIVMDINSGAILYGKNIDDQHFPASITKVLTALLALENGEMDDKIKFTQDSISFLEYGDAYIGMTPGEELTLEQSLYAVLLASANEVSYAVAENTGNKLGIGYNGFLDLMNKRSEELGCKNSHWMNANGLHDEQHYTSARDMALISSEAFQHPEFRRITKTLEYKIPPTNLMNEERVFQQNHKMLFEENTSYYQYCVGGKTGYTDQALSTLITFADNEDMQLVAVNLKTHGVHVYPDTKAMFDYAYDNFTKVMLSDAETSADIKTIPEDAYVVLPKGVDFSEVKSEIIMPEETGSKEGTVLYMYENNPVGSAVVTLSDSYIEKVRMAANEKVEAKQDEKKVEPKIEDPGLSVWQKVSIGIVAVVIVIIFIFVVRIRVELAKRRRKREKARRRRRRKEHGQQRHRKRRR